MPGRKINKGEIAQWIKELDYSTALLFKEFLEDSMNVLNIV